MPRTRVTPPVCGRAGVSNCELSGEIEGERGAYEAGCEAHGWQMTRLAVRGGCRMFSGRLFDQLVWHCKVQECCIELRGVAVLSPPMAVLWYHEVLGEKLRTEVICG